MSDELVIRHCAPTLASLKTGSLFSSAFSSRAEMLSSVRALNERLQGKGLRVLPMRYRAGIGLIYIYRPGKLSRDLRDADASRLLRDCGYPGGNENRCIRCLIDRLNARQDFPHEIGLFLGYPPVDVEGFMRHPCDCKCSGCWKVYGDVDAAQRTFARYRKCSDLYWKLWKSGKSMEYLTVAEN